jgi:hypothetical protein
MDNATYQIRFYKDGRNKNDYTLVQNESLLDEFKKERAQTSRPQNSFFLKKYIQPYFGSTIPKDDIGKYSELVIYEFSFYHDGDANIYEKSLRIV